MKAPANPLLILGSVLLLACLSGVWFATDLSVATVLSWQMDLQVLVNAYPVLSGVVYFSVFTLLTAACLPGASVLMLAAGGCMGLMQCTLLSTAASATGALITFWFARYLARDSVERKFKKSCDSLNTKLAAHEIETLLSLRLAPVIPFVALNLLAGLTRVRSWTFLWTSFLGMLPGTFLYCNAGAQVASSQKLEELVSLEVMTSLALLAVLPWIAGHLLRRRNRLPHSPS